MSAPLNTASLSDYDAGLLNDWGGGNVEWWQDYLRAEIGRANDFWRAQVESQSDALESLSRAMSEKEGELAVKDGHIRRLQDFNSRRELDVLEIVRQRDEALAALKAAEEREAALKQELASARLRPEPSSEGDFGGVGVVGRINAYLSNGGLFNPELADHAVVRDLLIDCRAALRDRSPASPSAANVKKRWALARKIYEARYPNPEPGSGVPHWDATAKAARLPWLACADAALSALENAPAGLADATPQNPLSVGPEQREAGV